MKDTDIAYCAGLIDGEGCILVKKSKPYRHLTGRVNPSYSCAIQVRMVDEAALIFLRDTLGGWMWREKRTYSTSNRPLFCWQATDGAAERILTLLLPFLRVKAAQAKNGLAFRRLRADARKHRTKITGYRNFPNAHGTGRRVANKAFSDDYVAMMEAHYATSRELNRIGPR